MKFSPYEKIGPTGKVTVVCPSCGSESVVSKILNHNSGCSLARLSDLEAVLSRKNSIRTCDEWGKLSNVIQPDVILGTFLILLSKEVGRYYFTFDENDLEEDEDGECILYPIKGAGISIDDIFSWLEIKSSHVAIEMITEILEVEGSKCFLFDGTSLAGRFSKEDCLKKKAIWMKFNV